MLLQSPIVHHSARVFRLHLAITTFALAPGRTASGAASLTLTSEWDDTCNELVDTAMS
jgi:hypothetical protein